MIGRVSINEDHSAVLVERRRSQRIVQLTFGALALGSLACGLGVTLLAHRLAVPPDTARIVASAFLLVAVVDALVLYGWERVFGPAR